MKDIDLGRDYVLENDIDLQGEEWTPLGSEETPFTGTFNGAGHSISNFKITQGLADVGIFVYSSGTIKNLGVSNFNIEILREGYIDVGGLVGKNRGAIESCYASGNINVNSNGYGVESGGLIGRNYGDISNSYAKVNVIASAFNLGYYSSYTVVAGGLVGFMYSGAIRNCYATGNVEAYYAQRTRVNVSSVNAGGLIGDSDGGEAENCYVTGNVKVGSIGGTEYVNGFLPCYLANPNFHPSESYNYRYSGQIIEASQTPINVGRYLVTEKTMEELQSVDFQTNTLGWSTEYWTFTEGEHPKLKWENA